MNNQPRAGNPGNDDNGDAGLDRFLLLPTFDEDNGYINNLGNNVDINIKINNSSIIRKNGPHHHQQHPHQHQHQHQYQQQCYTTSHVDNRIAQAWISSANGNSHSRSHSLPTDNNSNINKNKIVTTAAFATTREAREEQFIDEIIDVEDTKTNSPNVPLMGIRRSLFSPTPISIPIPPSQPQNRKQQQQIEIEIDHDDDDNEEGNKEEVSSYSSEHYYQQHQMTEIENDDGDDNDATPSLPSTPPSTREDCLIDLSVGNSNNGVNPIINITNNIIDFPIPNNKNNNNNNNSRTFSYGNENDNGSFNAVVAINPRFCETNNNNDDNDAFLWMEIDNHVPDEIVIINDGDDDDDQDKAARNSVHDELLTGDGDVDVDGRCYHHHHHYHQQQQQQQGASPPPEDLFRPPTLLAMGHRPKAISHGDRVDTPTNSWQSNIISSIRRPKAVSQGDRVNTPNSWQSNILLNILHRPSPISSIRTGRTRSGCTSNSVPLSPAATTTANSKYSKRSNKSNNKSEKYYHSYVTTDPTTTTTPPRPVPPFIVIHNQGHAIVKVTPKRTTTTTAAAAAAAVKSKWKLSTSRKEKKTKNNEYGHGYSNDVDIMNNDDIIIADCENEGECLPKTWCRQWGRSIAIAVTVAILILATITVVTSLIANHQNQQVGEQEQQQQQKQQQQQQQQQQLNPTTTPTTDKTMTSSTSSYTPSPTSFPTLPVPTTTTTTTTTKNTHNDNDNDLLLSVDVDDDDDDDAVLDILDIDFDDLIYDGTIIKRPYEGTQNPAHYSNPTPSPRTHPPNYIPSPVVGRTLPPTINENVDETSSSSVLDLESISWNNYVIGLLSIESPSTFTQLNDPSSPQFLALQWISVDSARREGGSIAYSMDESLQRYALATLYFSLSGGRGGVSNDNDAILSPSSFKWANDNAWLSSDMCDWYGITCDPSRSSVLGIDLSSNGLQGTLPLELKLLKYLENLTLSNNHIRGILPSEYSELNNLIELNLATNSITGSIPWEYEGGLGSSGFDLLKLLDLHVNKITGSIPSSIGNTMINLESINLCSNLLQGTIPSTIGSLFYLESLNFGNNNGLYGNVPDEICDTMKSGTTNLLFSVDDDDHDGLTVHAVFHDIIVDCTIDCNCCDQCCSSGSDDNECCFP